MSDLTTRNYWDEEGNLIQARWAAPTVNREREDIGVTRLWLS